MPSFDRLLALPGGVFGWLLLAALLEVSGDAFFQSAVHCASGASRWASIAAGALSLFFYGLVVKSSAMEFRKIVEHLCGFVLRASHRQSEIPRARQLARSCVGGILIISGGVVLRFSN